MWIVVETPSFCGGMIPQDYPLPSGKYNVFGTEARGARKAAEFVQSIPTDDPKRARVVCVGDVELPEAHYGALEPVVFGPDSESGRRALQIIGFCGGLWILSLVEPFASYLGKLGRMLGMLGMVYGPALLGLTLFDLFFRTRYFRIAPGYADLLTYSAFRRRPRRECYPLDGGTVVFLSNVSRYVQRLTIIIVRNNRCVHLWLKPTNSNRHIFKRFCQALQFSAPPAPLPSDMLVG